VMAALPARYTRADTTLKYMCWEGYNDPKVISSFASEHHAQLDIELIVDSPAGFSTLLSTMENAFDVVSIDSPWVSLMGQEKLCRPLDGNEFKDVFSHLYEQFSHPFTPLIQHGQISGIPTRWGLIGPTINTLYSDQQEFESYAPCFDAKYRGQIGIMDWGDWPIMPIALYAGVNPYQQLDDYQLKAIREAVRALFKNKPVFFSDLSLAQQSLLDGSIKSLIGTGTFLSSSLRKAGFRQIKTVVPSPINGLKQSIIWLEASAITTKTKNHELAKKLLKHLVSSQAAFHLSLTDYACNLSTNRHVESLYTPDQRSILQLDEAKAAWDKSFFHTLSPSITDLLALWQEELFLSGLL